MHQMWKTFRDSCSTRVFIQVDEKNALKHPKSWWLGVAPCSVVFSLIYLIDIREKWQILVKVIFDPSNCLENMNKHRETTLHIQIPYPGPKEHQNWAFGSNFTTSQVTMNAWNEAWKVNFFSISSNLLYSMDPETCSNKLSHQNTSLGAQGVPIWANGNRFQVWKWPYSTMKVGWKIIFCLLFSQILPTSLIQWTQKPVETYLPIKMGPLD